MIKKALTPSEARDMIVSKLSHNFGVIPTEATDEHYYKAIALILKIYDEPRICSIYKCR